MGMILVTASVAVFVMGCGWTHPANVGALAENGRRRWVYG